MSDTEVMGTSWHSYPRLYSLGHGAIAGLLQGTVIIEEKVDGSQFSWGVFGGQLKCRSKGAQLDPEAPEKMFIQAVETAKRLQAAGLLRDSWTYRGEFLAKPKHNTLKYERIPQQHIILFDVSPGQEQYLCYADKAAEATRLGLEVVPLLYKGHVSGVAELTALLDTTSCLGGTKVEGFVVKQDRVTQFGEDGKALHGKYVSEAFKEVHGKEWRRTSPGSADILETLALRYTTEGRWAKAVQHLREAGQLTDSPKDIGALIKETLRDVEAECGAEMREMLFAWAWERVHRRLVSGIPGWYKERLMKQQVEGDGGN